jgi:hypothetical protein
MEARVEARREARVEARREARVEARREARVEARREARVDSTGCQTRGQGGLHWMPDERSPGDEAEGMILPPALPLLGEARLGDARHAFHKLTALK